MIAVDKLDRIVVAAIEVVRNRIQEVPFARVRPEDGEGIRRVGAHVVQVPALFVLVVTERQEHRHRVSDDIEYIALIEIFLTHGRLGLEVVVEAEGVAQVDQEVGISCSDVRHCDPIQVVVVEVGKPLVRIALHREGKGLAVVALRLEGVLVAGAKLSLGIGRPKTQPIIVASVGYEPVDHGLEDAVHRGGRGRTVIVHTGVRAVLDIGFDRLGRHDVYDNGAIGRASDQLGGDEGEHAEGVAAALIPFGTGPAFASSLRIRAGGQRITAAVFRQALVDIHTYARTVVLVTGRAIFGERLGFDSDRGTFRGINGGFLPASPARCENRRQTPYT